MTHVPIMSNCPWIEMIHYMICEITIWYLTNNCISKNLIILKPIRYSPINQLIWYFHQLDVSVWNIMNYVFIGKSNRKVLGISFINDNQKFNKRFEKNPSIKDWLNFKVVS